LANCYRLPLLTGAASGDAITVDSTAYTIRIDVAVDYATLETDRSGPRQHCSVSKSIGILSCERGKSEAYGGLAGWRFPERSLIAGKMHFAAPNLVPASQPNQCTTM